MVLLDPHLLSVLGLPLTLEFQVTLEVLYNQVDHGAQCFPHQTYIHIPLDNLKETKWQKCKTMMKYVLILYNYTYSPTQTH